MLKNPKAKGSEYELKIAKKLTEWSGYQFMRTPNSGAMHSQYSDSRLVSDIVPPPDIHFPFSVECKKHEIPWEFSQLLAGTSEIWDFWKQVLRESTSEGMEPMLVFSKNRRDSYVMVRRIAYDALFLGRDIPHMYIHMNSLLEVMVLSLGDFLSNCTLQDVLDLKL
jgi:hypothetical protein